MLRQHKHRHKVACTSAHHEQMENLMGAEIFMLCIENRHFQCIDNTADRVDNASCEKPSERRSGQCMKDLGKCQHTQPPHADVDHGRKPIIKKNPAGLYDDPNQCHAPYQDA